MEENQETSVNLQVFNWRYWAKMLVLFLFCCGIGGAFAYFITIRHSHEIKNKPIVIKKSPIVDKKTNDKLLDKIPAPLNSPDSSQASLIRATKKITDANVKLQNIDKIVDPKQGLAIIAQSINELKQSKKILLSINENSLNYYNSLQHINQAESSIRIAEEWQQFFLEQEKQISLNHQYLSKDKPPVRRPLPELSIKNKVSFLSAMRNKTVALTFDDGPTREYTIQILEILRRNNITATFFVVGKRVRENCDILRAIYQLGHEIGNHTDTHPYLTKISPSQQIVEIRNTQESISQCLGFEYATNWFRAPYGDQDSNLLNIVHQMGLNSAQWTIDTHDWKKTSSSFSIQNMVKEDLNSAVILMHDGSKTNPNFQHPNENPSRQNTVNALQPMIDNLKNRGFNFVNLSNTLK